MYCKRDMGFLWLYAISISINILRDGGCVGVRMNVWSKSQPAMATFCGSNFYNEYEFDYGIFLPFLHVPCPRPYFDTRFEP